MPVIDENCNYTSMPDGADCKFRVHWTYKSQDFYLVKKCVDCEWYEGREE